MEERKREQVERRLQVAVEGRRFEIGNRAFGVVQVPQQKTAHGIERRRILFECARQRPVADRQQASIERKRVHRASGSVIRTQEGDLMEMGKRHPDQDGALAVDLRAGQERQIEETSVAISADA